MINFACKQIDFKDIIQCSFSLNKTEYGLLLFFLGQEETLTVAEVAKKQGLERSTVQKAVSKLLEKKLLERRQINLAEGGYRFVYEIIEKEAIKQELLHIVDGWHASVKEAIKQW